MEGDGDDDEDYVVTNIDSNEKLTIGEASKKFSVMGISQFKQDEKLEVGEGEEEEDDCYFDSKQVSLAASEQLEGGNVYSPPSIPEGGRLQFYRISAVGNSHDSDHKVYSVYYLDVRCNTASPNSWFVYRRYSQFRRLSDVLRSEGYYVPVLPGKKLLGTFNVDFIKQRKSDLEAWVQLLSEQHLLHPGAKDPQNHPYYRQFLTEGANQPPQPLTKVFPEPTLSTVAESKSSGPSNGGQAKLQKVGIDDFELVRVIGKGSFGKVTLVRKKTDQRLYAMKVLSKPNIIKRKQVQHTKTERKVLGSMNHPFIVKLYYAFQTEAKLYFVLDYCAGGELFFHLSRFKKFPEHMARFYAAEISLALDALHAIDVVYRDLKPENILLDGEGHVKLADFGLAKEGVSEAAEGAHSMCGTPEYLSPEVLDRQGHGTAVDWWNLGMVTYEMITGLPPWYTTDREKLFDRLRNAPLKFPFYVSRTAASFIQGLLVRNPLERLGARGGADVTAHSFFSSIDFDALYRREIAPPFNPCRNQEEKDSDNFEKEFTAMPVISVDGPHGTLGPMGASRMEEKGEETFLNFTYEEESMLDSLREDFISSRAERRK